MKKLLGFLCVALLFFGMLGVANAELIDWGANNEFFHDTDTGLYWYDPVEFKGFSRVQVDNWLDQHSGWMLADIDSVQGLLEKYLQPSGAYYVPCDGCSIPELGVMGEWTTGVPGGMYVPVRWYGLIDDPVHEYAGWEETYYADQQLMIMYYRTEFIVDTEWSYQDGRPTKDTSGAWLVSNVNPVPEPTTMLLLGSGLVGLAGFRRKFKK